MFQFDQEICFIELLHILYMHASFVYIEIGAGQTCADKDVCAWRIHFFNGHRNPS